MKPDPIFELPVSWKWITLGDLAKSLQNGIYKPSKYYKDDGIACLRMYNIHTGEIVWKDIKRMNISDEEIEKFKLDTGDILINRVNSRELVGKAATIHEGLEQCIYESKNIRFKPYKNFIKSELISLWLRINGQAYFNDNAQQTVGMASINQEQISSMPFPLPPLNEQHRIVAKIEALTARSRKAREALDAIPALLDQFRQSVLAAAFRGDLTADWRAQNPDVEPAEKLLERNAAQMGLSHQQIYDEIGKDNTQLPGTWEWTKLKAVIQKIQAGKNFKCPEIPVQKNTIGLAKISAVTWGEFDPLETKTIEDLSKVDPNLFIQKGDLLVTRANTIELVGASVVVRDISHKIMLSDKVWRIHTLEIDKEYLNFYLRSKIGRKEIESRASGNQQSMRNISQKAFLDIVCMLPPLMEQIEISRRITSAFSVLEKVKQQYQSGLSDIDQLDQSILAKAFRGELVSQAPNDEPASVLLERIRAEREKTKKKGEGGKAKGERRRAKGERLKGKGLRGKGSS